MAMLVSEDADGRWEGVPVKVGGYTGEGERVYWGIVVWEVYWRRWVVGVVSHD